MRHRSRRPRHTLRKSWLLALATFAVVLTACSTEIGPHNRQNSLRPHGTYSHTINNLFTPILWVAIVVGVLVVGATIFIAIRFRAKKGSDDRPKQIHGSTPFEIGWTIVPALILAVIAVPTISTIFDLASKPANPINVTVIGKQWWWQFEYPKQDGVDKQVVTADELHIPTGRDVYLTLKACDPSLPGGFDGGPGCNVIHSFWVPELAGKTDVVPGHENHMKIKTDTPGTYLGQCAEYCGLSHANMRFRVIVQTPSDYEAWLANQQAGPAVSVKQAGEAGTLFSKKFQCTNCHTTEDSTLSTYGPNLTHLASRTTFASGYYALTKPKLVEWILDAPGLIPMQSEYCRLPPAPDQPCVGMPSFTQNTPPGQPTMTHQEAETIADYLLQLK
jgi:cytochrome c oxidase subunit II